ncbi:hypothetical protein DPMN_178805 [Dreissena polymorpha]|uniref:Uncharacterized protein n=1 Tax=Dreissena polymorpha TaxID=45954 RepID=A0A9D4ILJ7_DREPO|nr:hypothetical protein DPMN_178805 [Dreissena polymorpha]
MSYSIDHPCKQAGDYDSYKRSGNQLLRCHYERDQQSHQAIEERHIRRPYRHTAYRQKANVKTNEELLYPIFSTIWKRGILYRAPQIKLPQFLLRLPRNHAVHHVHPRKGVQLHFAEPNEICSRPASPSPTSRLSND